MPREYKGASILASKDDYVSLDLETTGFDTRQDDILEIGAIRVRDGKPVERYEQLVNPGYAIPIFITNLTGISNDMVKDAPVLADVLPVFLDWLGDDLILGHNVNFDVNFLYDSAETLLGRSVSNDFIDTLRLARYLYPKERHNRLSDLIVRFNIAETQSHRSIADVEQTVACYQWMLRYMAENGISFPDKDGRRYSDTPLFRGKDQLLRVMPQGDITPDPAFDGMTFVFTGALKKMTRSSAQQAVINLGGINGKTVTKDTNYLVTGSTDYNASLKGAKSSKWLKAEKLRLAGQDINIISEDVFYDMLGDSVSVISMAAETSSNDGELRSASSRAKGTVVSEGAGGFLNAKTKKKELKGDETVTVDSHPLQRLTLEDFPLDASLWVTLKNVVIDNEPQISVTINGSVRVGRIPEILREKYAAMIPSKDAVAAATVAIDENGNRCLRLSLPE
ncbi:DNA polymerase III [Bifidobacterium biavatii DSM 23969]|uniref:DNA polymerase III n=2 Tax=Bifidobacterium biavatii TaxID=762212 RepID=A0A086ZTS2_9BIFI|nr:DNA polymerase III [Bifidobacterium biavatii DSM 23969]